jgi:IS30 family transposase
MGHMTKSQKKEITAYHIKGESTRTIAKRFGCSNSTISRIVAKFKTENETKYNEMIHIKENNDEKILEILNSDKIKNGLKDYTDALFNSDNQGLRVLHAAFTNYTAGVRTLMNIRYKENFLKLKQEEIQATREMTEVDRVKNDNFREAFLNSKGKNKNREFMKYVDPASLE